MVPRGVVVSPNGRLEARLYDLGPGMGGGTRVNVKVSRCWLPYLVEDMGTIWCSTSRNAESSVSWAGNSAVVIGVGEISERVPLNMFQWFPK